VVSQPNQGLEAKRSSFADPKMRALLKARKALGCAIGSFAFYKLFDYTCLHVRRFFFIIL
jgi:hypothetical protein